MQDKLETGTGLRQDASASSSRTGWWQMLFKIAVPLLILGVGITAAANIRQTGPKARRRPPTAMAPTVQVEAVTRSNEQIVVKVMGSVVPAQQIVL